MSEIKKWEETKWETQARWCPFCGESASVTTDENGFYEATCNNCGIETPKYTTFKGLLTYWNGEEK